MVKDNCCHPQYAVVDGTCTLCNTCAHTVTTQTGLRMPLLYGSAPIIECNHCNYYQLSMPGKNEWREGPVELKIAEAEKRIEEMC